ncbi:unnamed protein product [Chrysoparadoxa australica]
MSFTKSLLILFFTLSIISYSEAQSKRKRKIIIAVVTEARTYRGTPYHYGGMSRRGIDCSGLIYNSFDKVGIDLPRTAKEQSKIGSKKGWGGIRPGDIVYFKFKEKGEKWWHSGMITDTTDPNEIKFIHASSSRGVVESTLNQEYYKDNVKKFRRVIK